MARLERSLNELGFRPKIPVSMEEFLKPSNWKKWKKEKGLLALNLFHPKKPLEQIDILTGVGITFGQAKGKKFTIETNSGLRVHLVSIDDLIKMKKKANRQQDLADIDALKRLKKYEKK